MRFEMNADSVIALCRAIYVYCESADGSSPVNRSLIVSDCRKLIQKVKVYGLKAFRNRESFRTEIKELEELVESVIRDGKNTD